MRGIFFVNVPLHLMCRLHEGEVVVIKCFVPMVIYSEWLGWKSQHQMLCGLSLLVEIFPESVGDVIPMPRSRGCKILSLPFPLPLARTVHRYHLLYLAGFDPFQSDPSVPSVRKGLTGVCSAYLKTKKARG